MMSRYLAFNAFLPNFLPMCYDMKCEHGDGELDVGCWAGRVTSARTKNVCHSGARYVCHKTGAKSGRCWFYYY